MEGDAKEGEKAGKPRENGEYNREEKMWRKEMRGEVRGARGGMREKLRKVAVKGIQKILWKGFKYPK